MTDLENKSSDQLQRLANLLQDFSPLEKSDIPKVNLKKVKLSKFQNLENKLKNKNLTTIKFNDSLFNLIDKPQQKTKDNIQTEGGLSLNPLRKKDNSQKKDITFTLEAQVIQDDENIILSPSIVSMPPLKEDFVSISGNEEIYAWPPINENKKKKNKKQKKNKPYFIGNTIKEKQKVNKLKINFTEQKIEKPIEKIEKLDTTAYEKHKKEIEEINESSFPWATNENENTTTGEVFTRSLEDELIDIPQPITESHEDIQATPPLFENNLNPIFKAVKSDISQDLLSDINKLDFSQNGIEFQGKASSMIDKSGPIKIILLGGLTATLAYLLWTNVMPELENYSDSTATTNQVEEKIIVRDLFSKENRLKAKSIFERILKPKNKEKYIEIKNEEKLTGNSIGITPILESDRLSLIERAKSAIEFRRDPFGQEEVLPADFFTQKKKKEEEAAKPLPDIELQRKQVELVGVISTREKDLALVNLYTADYGVRPDDDKEIRETKLKAALAMAIPNRLEVSILDPVDDWYVKQIFKSKSRSEDPTLDLVKGDKKFKLRVGQKLLLPEEKAKEE